MDEDELECAFYDLLDEHDCMPHELMWTTMDGQRMPVGEMSSRHLAASIIYAVRRKVTTDANVDSLREQIDQFPAHEDDYTHHLADEERSSEQLSITIYVLTKEQKRRDAKEQRLTISPRMARLRKRLAELPGNSQ